MFTLCAVLCYTVLCSHVTNEHFSEAREGQVRSRNGFPFWQWRPLCYKIFFQMRGGLRGSVRGAFHLCSAISCSPVQNHVSKHQICLGWLPKFRFAFQPNRHHTSVSGIYIPLHYQVIASVSGWNQLAPVIVAVSAPICTAGLQPWREVHKNATNAERMQWDWSELTSLKSTTV